MPTIWRPTDSGCLYVVPDLHGNKNILDKISTRIFPLRKSDGIHDKLVFLGDYIDRLEDSHLVIDKLIELKKKYKDNIIFLLGNHELMLMETIGVLPRYKYAKDYKYGIAIVDMWLNNGGLKTLYGYMIRSGVMNPDPYTLPKGRIKDFIPKEHVDFLLDLLPYYETDNYIFAHAGFDPNKKLEDTSLDTLTWERRLNDYVKKAIQNNEDLPWDKTLVVGHDYKGPLIKEKYMMLDCGSSRRLLLVELNSMQAFMVYPEKDKMIKYQIMETIIRGPVFRRV